MRLKNAKIYILLRCTHGNMLKVVAREK